MAYADGAYPLLTDATATGDALEWRGGSGIFTVYGGTLGGATVALEWSPDGGDTWLPADANGDTFTTFTGIGSGGFTLPGCLIRATVSGGSPADLNASVFAVSR